MGQIVKIKSKNKINHTEFLQKLKCLFEHMNEVKSPISHAQNVLRSHDNENNFKTKVKEKFQNLLSLILTCLPQIFIVYPDTESVKNPIFWITLNWLFSMQLSMIYNSVHTKNENNLKKNRYAQILNFRDAINTFVLSWMNFLFLFFYFQGF